MSEQRIGVCGAGAMGSGIAEVAACAGHRVSVFDVSRDALTSAPEALAGRMERKVARGKVEAAQAQRITGRIAWTDSLEDLAQCQLVIEAVVEKHSVKQALYAALEEHLADDAILATNTSSLPVTMLAASLRVPERFVGLHFFNPAPVMKLVEVIPSLFTDPAHVRAAMDVLSRWGKSAVQVRDVPGFLVNRLARPFYGESWRALEEEAASPAMIDYLLRTVGGFRLGALELGDLIGHDVNEAVGRSVHAAYYGRTRFRPSLAQARLVMAGRLGRKSGHEIAPRVNAPDAVDAADLACRITVSRARGPMRTMCETLHGDIAHSRDLAADIAMIGDVAVALSAGFSARRVARDMKKSAAVIDYVGAASVGDASVMPFSASDDAAQRAAAWFIRGLGRTPAYTRDRPGGIVLRTYLQLANAAADALVDCVADADAIDNAMTLGMNFPTGPLSWVRAFGPDRAIAALAAIATETGDSMYMPSEGLGRL